MSKCLSCPACGNTTFEQDRITSYDETAIVSFSLKGEIEEERIEDQECNGEESSGAYRCEECGWELVDENGDPINDPDEIVAHFERASKSKHVGTHVREAFKEFIEGDAKTVDVDGEQVGLDWFGEWSTSGRVALEVGLRRGRHTTPRGHYNGPFGQPLKLGAGPAPLRSGWWFPQYPAICLYRVHLIK